MLDLASLGGALASVCGNAKSALASLCVVCWAT